MFYEQRFLLSLLLTLITEIPIIIFFVKKVYRIKKINFFKIVFVGFIASSLTLPYFWLILPIFILNRILNRNLYILVGEILIVFFEAIIYNQFLKLKLSNAIIVSLIANMGSVLLGLIIH